MLSFSGTVERQTHKPKVFHIIIYINHIDYRARFQGLQVLYIAFTCVFFCKKLFMKYGIFLWQKKYYSWNSLKRDRCSTSKATSGCQKSLGQKKSGAGAGRRSF